MTGLWGLDPMSAFANPTDRLCDASGGLNGIDICGRAP